jgi:hypothetical protein
MDEATANGCDEPEQRMGFRAILSDKLEMSIRTEVLGVEVTVENPGRAHTE